MKDYKPTKKEKSWMKNIFRKFAEIQEAKKKNPSCFCWGCQVGYYTNEKENDQRNPS